MAQVTVRLPDEVAADVKRAALRAGLSMNGWVLAVLSAAVDPELEGDEVERVRERLARAGLLAEPAPPSRPRPSQAAVARARAAAGRGRPLSDHVAEGRR